MATVGYNWMKQELNKQKINSHNGSPILMTSGNLLCNNKLPLYFP